MKTTNPNKPGQFDREKQGGEGGKGGQSGQGGRTPSTPPTFPRKDEDLDYNEGGREGNQDR